MINEGRAREFFNNGQLIDESFSRPVPRTLIDPDDPPESLAIDYDPIEDDPFLRLDSLSHFDMIAIRRKLRNGLTKLLMEQARNFRERHYTRREISIQDLSRVLDYIGKIAAEFDSESCRMFGANKISPALDDRMRERLRIRQPQNPKRGPKSACTQR